MSSYITGGKSIKQGMGKISNMVQGVIDESNKAIPQRVGNIGALPGAPDTANIRGVGKIGLGQDANIIESAKAYSQSSGIPLVEMQDYKRIDPNFAKNVADEFTKLKHDPSNPAVQESYSALKNETLEQYKQLIDDGVETYFIDPSSTQNSPYEALIELTENKRLGIFPTKEGYGDGAGVLDVADDPLLEETGLFIDGKPLLYNDAFRGVHDYYGHGKSGVGFRAMGEENAYRSHAGMYSPAARPAAATETRGQNSWLNFGPHGDFNKTANANDTIFADQKKALLPNWAVTQGTPLGDKRFRDILENDRAEAFGDGSGFENAIDGNGRIKLAHYSRSERDTIDPKKYGAGLSGRTRAEKNRSVDPNFIPRSFYGIEGTDNPYKAEVGLGSVKNEVDFPISQLYDMANDPENYLAQIPTKSPKGFTLSPQERNTALEKKIKDEGWSGMFDRSSGGDIATLFEPLDVGKYYDAAAPIAATAAGTMGVFGDGSYVNADELPSSIPSRDRLYKQGINQNIDAAIENMDDRQTIEAPLSGNMQTVGNVLGKYNRAIKGSPMEYILPLDGVESWANKAAYGQDSILDRTMSLIESAPLFGGRIANQFLKGADARQFTR